MPRVFGLGILVSVFTFWIVNSYQVYCADTIHGSLDISCGTCHSGEYEAVPYPDAVFDHNTTAFQLNGQHLVVSCRECHVDLVFRGTQDNCSSCHDDIHNGELGGDCSRCHTTQSFTVPYDVTGFHDTTRFPLRGAHLTVSCADCHISSDDGVWRGLSTDCISCHSDDYDMTDTPDHRAAGIPYDCAMCHDEQPGFRLVYDHSLTGFELTGAHVILECVECHNGSFFSALPADCSTCHRADYNRTTEPVHSTAGYSLNCEDCHTTSAWVPATIGRLHESYPLTGAHLTVDCISCHTDGEYFGTLHDCAACHTDDYSLAKNPDHQALQLSQVCEECHTTGNWSPSTFTHDTSSFPLTGSHAIIDCTVCHTASYGLHPPADCGTCHAEEYEEAADHVAQLYPTGCSDCHTTTAWIPSSFTHSEFPVYSGNHRSRWNTCADCHPTAGDFQVFTCFTCHLPTIHGRSYTSIECYQCHPDGRE